MAYWYFREPRFQATTHEQTTLLVNYDYMVNNANQLYSDQERWGTLATIPNRATMMLGLDGNPMFHHYSWVGSEDTLLKKVATWGHRDDNIPWADLVRDEFTHEFNGTDFVHGYRYIDTATTLKGW